MKDRKNSETTVHPMPGVSGKRVTLLVLAGLLLLGVGVSYTLWSYDRMDQARQQSREAWRELANHLATRYRFAEKVIAQGVDSRVTKMEFGEQFQLAVDRFRTTSIAEQQALEARKVESLLDSAEFSGSGLQTPPVAAELQTAVENYNRAMVNEQKLLDSGGGKVLDIFLEFPTPKAFELSH